MPKEAEGYDMKIDSAGGGDMKHQERGKTLYLCKMLLEQLEYFLNRIMKISVKMGMYKNEE